MIWLDYILLGIVALSALYSVFRGFVREVLSLVGWVLAFWVALTFSPQASDFLEAFISVPGARFAVAFLLLFLSVLVASIVVARLVVSLIKLGGLGGLDRLVGAGFGVLRGVLIATVLVMMGGFSPLAQEPVWQQSVMVDYFLKIALWASDNIPEDVVGRVQDHALL